MLTVGASGVLGNDSDANSDPLTAILTSGVANGALTFNANGGFTYTPNPNFNGSDSFSYKANDGTQDSNVVTVTVTVTAVNDAPVNSVPGPQQTPKNTNRVFSAANNNPISISDADAGGATVQVQLTATTGTVTLPVLTGLTFTVGDGTSDATMTFTGTIANINLRLDGATFIPTNDFTGTPATLQIVTSDLGGTGSGGTLTDSDTITINVNSLGIFTANQDIGGPCTGWLQHVFGRNLHSQWRRCGHLGHRRPVPVPVPGPDRRRPPDRTGSCRGAPTAPTTGRRPA